MISEEVQDKAYPLPSTPPNGPSVLLQSSGHALHIIKFLTVRSVISSIPMTEALPNLTVLISGSGSNLQALIDARSNGVLRANILMVILSLETAYGLERANKAGIPTKIHTLKLYYLTIPTDLLPEDKKKARSEARETFNQDLLKIILYGDRYGSEESVAATPRSGGHKRPDLIVCAGWMLILSKGFLTNLAPYGVPIINLHPALPGQFEGTHAIERSWKAAQDGTVDKTGIMIHKVIPEVDKGEPVLVKELNVIKGETLEHYEERVHSTEHSAIVEATIKVLETEVKRTFEK